MQAMGIPGVDPSGYYFMEYMRASLMQMAIQMLRLPTSTLVFLMVVVVGLRPFLSFRVHPEAALLSVCSFLCLLGMLAVWAYVGCIERQLLPTRVPHYLVVRYHVEVGGETDAEYLGDYTPPYKLQKQKVRLAPQLHACNCLQSTACVQFLGCLHSLIRRCECDCRTRGLAFARATSTERLSPTSTSSCSAFGPTAPTL